MHLLILVNLINCNGQDKKNSKFGNNDQNRLSISDNFNISGPLHFDHNDKSVFSSNLVKNKGKFTTHYLPISEESINFCENFEKSNNIKPLFDELNSSHYYSDDDNLKINEILRKKITSNKGFKEVGSFISAKFIDIENDEEYSINYPYTIEYYQKKNGKWLPLVQKKISTVDEDQSYNNRTNLTLLVTDKAAIKKDQNQYTNKEKITIITNNSNWSADCNSNNNFYLDEKVISQFSFESKFSMNAYLKKKNQTEYEVYLVDFSSLIPLHKNMMDNANFDKTKPVATFLIINDQTLNFTWIGFFNKKTKKIIEEKNPFDNSKNPSILRSCNY